MPDKVGLDKHKQTSLQGISNKARYNKSHRFQNLFGCLNEGFLIESFRLMNRNAAPGVDRQSWQDYEANLSENARALVERLRTGRYRARLIRRRFIPKLGGKHRPLGIPIIEDKLLQKAVSRILTAIWEPEFTAFSFGYRPNIGAKDAVKTLKLNLQYGSYGYVVEADIQRFFDSIDHDWLLRMLALRINDRSFLQLIVKWLKAGILEEDGKVVHPSSGTPQGGVVSPVLANIYLHHALDLWFEKIVKNHCKGKAIICRYADDYVCAFQYRSEAEAFYRVLPKRLSKFHLAVAAEKTRMMRFSRFHPSHRRRFQFLGFEYYWANDRRGEPRVHAVTARSRLRESLRVFSQWVKRHRHLPKRLFFAVLKAKLRGYNNYFGIRGNARAVGKFYRLSMYVLFKWLNRRSQRKSMNWIKFKGLLERLEMPRAIVGTERYTKPVVFA